MSQEKVSKIAIIGAGNVGTAVAYACMMQGLGRRLALYDVNRAKVEAEVLDLNHGLQFVPAAGIHGSDDIGVCADADVAVITAGAREKPGQSQADLAAANVQLCRKLVPDLLRVAPAAILLCVTNPVDVITYAVVKLSGLSSRRVLGSGTVLDSSRFRYLIAERCRVAVQEVHAYVAGARGEGELPLWSSASIATVPLSAWAVPGHGKLTVRDRTEIFQNVKQAADMGVDGKGATRYAVGLATAQIISAIVNDECRVLPVSSLLSDYRGISDVCLSVPSIVNRGGVEAPLPVPMNDAEELGLRNSADKLREMIGTLGL